MVLQLRAVGHRFCSWSGRDQHLLEHSGPASSVAGVDPDEYAGWAMWSGTSFAAPRWQPPSQRSCLRPGGRLIEAAAIVMRSGVNIEDLGIHIVLRDVDVVSA